MSSFDLNDWNAAAEAQLLVEYRTIAASVASSASASISTTAVSYRGEIPFGPRLLKTASFAMANTILCELPVVLNACADDRMCAIQAMIAKVAASAAIAFSAECTAAIQEALLRHCEDIATSCITSAREKKAAQNIEPHASNIAIISMTLAVHAFSSLWHYITTKLSSLQTPAETSDYCSSEELVRACASSVSRIVVSLRIQAYGNMLSEDSVGIVIESIISIALCTLTRWIVDRKNERGGWVPWLGSMLRGLIVADERQHHWTSLTFDAIEGQITPSLICPITMSLVAFDCCSVDPIIGGPCGHVYEREPLYLHLQISGRDPLSNKPASALNYRRSMVAARLAAEIARRYGARLEPLTSL